MGASAPAHPAIPSRRSTRSYEIEPRRLPLEWLLPILGLLIVVAIGLGALALRRASSTAPLRQEMSALRADVGMLHARLAAEQRALTKTRSKLASLQKDYKRAPSAGRVSQLQDGVDQLSAQMRMLEVCVPQLQQGLVGIRMQTSNVKGWLTGATLIKPATLTPGCASALAG